MSLSNLLLIKHNYEQTVEKTITKYETSIVELENLTDYEFTTATFDNNDIINDSDNICFYDNKIKQNSYGRRFRVDVNLSNIVNITPGGAQNYEVSYLQLGNLISGWVWWDFFTLNPGLSASFDFSLPVDRLDNFTSPLEAWGSIAGFGSSGYASGYLEAVAGTKTIRCIVNSVYSRVGPTTFISQINYYI